MDAWSGDGDGERKRNVKWEKRRIEKVRLLEREKWMKEERRAL